MRPLVLAAVVLATTIFAGPTFAESLQFKASLSPQSEVPPHPDVQASGTVKATFDTASMKLTYTADYKGLTGPATMAHFHGPAPVGKNADVMVPVTSAVTSPIEGSAVLTADQAKALEGGMMYFNVHTAANKGGEIRGQLEKGM